MKLGLPGVHFEDQLSSAKKCGHLGGKVLVPTQEAINKLVAARLAADVLGVPTLIVARTDADAADLLTADVDPRDQPFILQEAERTNEGFYRIRCGVEAVHCPRPGLRALRRPDLDGNLAPRPGAGPAICRSHSRQISRQAAGLQLLAVVQLGHPS